MNARRAARELALLSLFQMDRGEHKTKTPERLDLQELILGSVRALVNEAQEQAQTAAAELAAVSHQILEMEADHPTNLKLPIEADLVPVPIPNTREMTEKIERCLQACEYVVEALRIPEYAALAGTPEVQNYANRLIQLVTTHKEEVDDLINRFSTEWRVDRLVKMDRLILRLAVAEMRFVEDVDHSVSINEAVELAKQYSADDSYRFINGVLGAVAEALTTEGASRV